MHTQAGQWSRGLVVGLLIAAVTGCSSIVGSDVEIRFRNASALDLHDFVYQSGGEPLVFARIPAGTTTAYRLVDRSYSYGFIEFRVDTLRYVQQPIDYVGETPLSGGQYTYTITVDPSDRSFGAVLRRDG